MEHLLNAPYFQVTVGIISGLGLLMLAVSMVTFKFFMPRLGKALLSPSPHAVESPASLLVNPEFCNACKAEHERSLENKEKISVLFDRTKDMEKALGDLCVDMAMVKTGNNEILRTLKRLENFR